MKPIVIVIDDEPHWHDRIRDRLAAMFGSTFEVICEETGEAALELARRRQVALVVLDAMLKPGKLQGEDVLRQLRSDTSLQHIPVAMLSAFVDVSAAFRWEASEHVSKKQFDAQFEPRVHHLMARAATWPFDSTAEPTLSLFVRHDAPVDMVVGIIEYHEQTTEDLDLDVAAFTTKGRAAYGPQWRVHARSIGAELYRALMKGHPEIANAIWRALDHSQRVNVAGTIDMLEVPLEFLPDLNGREYFVLNHPFSRSVVTARPLRGFSPGISPKFLNDLHRAGAALRVLLVASNTGNIPKVDQEVADIQALFANNPMQLRTEVKVLSTPDATLDAVSHELETGRYHIVHYAGHGEFVAQRTLEHRLVFKRVRDVSPDYLPETKLRWLWSKHPPSLFYMSCCRSAASGGRTDLLNNDLLGLIDASLCAGVPAVIGFRWPVSDQGGYDLSLTFYEQLLRTGRPDHALCTARSRSYREHPDDPAWLSPVLVMQPP